MAMVNDVQRFEVWLVELNPTQGTETNKRRPRLILSPNELSQLKTVIVAPMTSKGFKIDSRIEITFLGKSGLIVLDQIRIIDKSRLINKLGSINSDTQIKVCEIPQEMFVL